MARYANRPMAFADATLVHVAQREGIKTIGRLLMTHASEFQHPNPEQAIEFALLSMGAVLYATVLEEEPLYSLSDPDAMEAELTRMIFMYLGIRE